MAVHNGATWTQSSERADDIVAVAVLFFVYLVEHALRVTTSVPFLYFPSVLERTGRILFLF